MKLKAGKIVILKGREYKNRQVLINKITKKGVLEGEILDLRNKTTTYDQSIIYFIKEDIDYVVS